MSRPPRSPHAWHRDPPPPDDDAPPSKTRLKREMHTLQDLGERLAELPPDRLQQLGLPDALVTAINEFRRFNKWEARRRQMQYIGRLMRDIDAAPVTARLDAWSHSTRESVAGFHAAEAWRDRLLAEPEALAAFMDEHSAANRVRLAELISRAHAERAGGKPPASARLLFRAISSVIK